MNFDGCKVENKCGSSWVNRDSNRSINMTPCYLNNTSIIIVEYIILIDDILVVKNNYHLSIEIQNDSKIVIDCILSCQEKLMYYIFKNLFIKFF